MAILGAFTKQPADVLDYQFDYSAWLADRNDTIATAVVTTSTVAGDASPLVIANTMNALGVVKFYASGGTHGNSYEVTCTVTTVGSPSRTKLAEMIIRVKQT